MNSLEKIEKLLDSVNATKYGLHIDKQIYSITGRDVFNELPDDVVVKISLIEPELRGKILYEIIWGVANAIPPHTEFIDDIVNAVLTKYGK